MMGTNQANTKDKNETAQAGDMLLPDVENPSLTRPLTGWDENHRPVALDVVEEKPLTIYLNGQEIVTLMTIRDYPEWLALGYLLNQDMLEQNDVITAIDYDEDIETIVIRTKRKTNYEAKLKKKTHSSGCAVGTLFGDIMESFEKVTLPPTPHVTVSSLLNLINGIQMLPSLYLKAGAIHGCVLCDEKKPLIYMEDVGRHNAVDKIAGFLYQNSEHFDATIFYTTGRLTSEMVIKAVVMGMTILISRSGFTAWGVELADKAGLTLIGRARGKRMTVLTHPQRLTFDAAITQPHHRAKRAGARGVRGVRD